MSRSNWPVNAKTKAQSLHYFSLAVILPEMPRESSHKTTSAGLKFSVSFCPEPITSETNDRGELVEAQELGKDKLTIQAKRT